MSHPCVTVEVRPSYKGKIELAIWVKAGPDSYQGIPVKLTRTQARNLAKALKLAAELVEDESVTYTKEI